MSSPRRATVLALAGTVIGLVGWAGAEAQSPPSRIGKLPAPLPTLSPYAKHVLSLGPVGYWRLGEARGPVAQDSSGHKHNGVYHGQPLFHQPGAIANDPDRAVGLRDRSYVEIAANRAFSVDLKKGLTVEAWLRPDRLDFPGETKDPYVHWLGKGEAGQLEWGFRFYSRTRKDGTPSSRPNRISAYIWNAAGGEGAGAFFQETLTPGQWIHVVAVYQPPGPGAGVLIYRDGVLKKGPPSKGTLYSTFQIKPTAGNSPVRLGTRDLASFLTGGLDEVAIYPRVLTAEEIRTNHRLGTKSGPVRIPVPDAKAKRSARSR
jgi:hypothetical protein